MSSLKIIETEILCKACIQWLKFAGPLQFCGHAEGHKPYPHSLNVFDVIEDSAGAMRESIVEGLPAIEFNEIPEKDLLKDGWGSLGADAYKHINNPDLIECLDRAGHCLHQAVTQGHDEGLHVMVDYTLVRGVDVDEVALTGVICKHMPTKEEQEMGACVMSAAERLRGEGSERTIQQIRQ